MYFDQEAMIANITLSISIGYFIIQDTKNYKSRSFTILGKFYLEICRKYIG
jgi:hypothetical protein